MSDKRERNAAYQRKWYQANKELQKQRSAVVRKRRMREIQLFLCEYLSQHPCIVCGETDIRVLDLDHVRGVKDFDISQAPSRGVSQRRLEDELAKCDALCRNCHHRRHCDELGWYRSRFLANKL